MFETVPDDDEDDDEDMSNSDAEGSDLSEGTIFCLFYEIEMFPDVVKNYKTLMTQIRKASQRSLHQIIWNLSFQGLN